MSGFKPSYAGIGAMLKSHGLVEEMARRAEKVAERARETAHVDEDGPHPGRYRDAFEVTSGPDGGSKGDRAYGKVRNAAPEAVFNEFGATHTPRYRTLGKALDAARDA